MKFTDFEASTTHLFKIQAIFLEADDPSLLLLSATFQVAFRAWNLLELLILRRKWIGEIFAIQLAKILAALATLINRLFSDLRCQISGGHSSTESSLENWLWFSTSPYSGLKSVSSLPFDSWLSSPQFSAAWFSSKFCCAKLYCIPNGFLQLWQISSKWASFALNSVLGKGIYGSALQSLLSSTVSIFFEFLFLGILSDLHLTFWVFNIVNLRTVFR